MLLLWQCFYSSTPDEPKRTCLWQFPDSWLDPWLRNQADGMLRNPVRTPSLAHTRLVALSSVVRTVQEALIFYGVGAL